MLRDNDSRCADDPLQSVAETVQRGSGPSFFTKFLYAPDAPDRQPGRALILDRFVLVALKAVDCNEISGILCAHSNYAAKLANLLWDCLRVLWAALSAYTVRAVSMPAVLRTGNGRIGHGRTPARRLPLDADDDCEAE